MIESNVRRPAAVALAWLIAAAGVERLASMASINEVDDGLASRPRGADQCFSMPELTPDPPPGRGCRIRPPEPQRPPSADPFVRWSEARSASPSHATVRRDIDDGPRPNGRGRGRTS